MKPDLNKSGMQQCNGGSTIDTTAKHFTMDDIRAGKPMPCAFCLPQPSKRGCDDLGVCQSPTKACPPHTICARKPTPHYFAPGVINAASTDLQSNDAGWLLDVKLMDWLAAVVILILLGVICGFVA
jgi:hypothetical protein